MHYEQMRSAAQTHARRRAGGWLHSAVALAMLWGAPVSADTAAPQLPRGKGEQCVEPTDEMRRDHMNFLMHQRDETVHRGIRTTRHSLAECLSCHAREDAQGNYIAVNAEGEFCQVCHAFTAVSMDCFGCHASKPSPESDRVTER